MASLKDIMDVDVEPLESQAMRSRQAAQQQGNQQPAQSLPSQPTKDNSNEQAQVSRRKSNRVSKSSSQGPTSRPSLSRRRSSGTAESMESDGHPPGGPSRSPTPRQQSRGPNPPDSVRYTPVTGRVSRAKKGQPVHVCDQCDPPRVFTRAEHLRRHQLGHQKPAYPCTFEDCEKAFHRQDLLARHLNRHETQGEKAYKAGDERSRSSSSSSDSPSPRFNVQTPLTGEAPRTSQTSDATSSGIPRTSAGTGSGMTAAIESLMPNFGGVNLSSQATSGQFERAAGLGLTGSGPGVTTSISSSGISHVAPSYSTSSLHNLAQGSSFVDMSQSSTGPMFSTQDPTGNMFPVTTTAAGLPMLTVQVPDPPALSYSGSPWYSSDSTWSTPSERQGAWTRDRSASIATNPENWNGQSMVWTPPYQNSTMQTPRTAGLESVPETYESPPYLSPHISPNISYPLVGVSNSAGGYQELVGIPTLSVPYKSHAQSLSAPTNRLAKSELARRGGRSNQLVDAPHLGSPSGEPGALSLSERMVEYLIAYQLHLEPVYAIIHPETFKSRPNDLVRMAMAALGSQFHILPGDRENGSHLHECCIRMIATQSEWNYQTMQAIYLTEVFGRFRSQKIDVRPSAVFRKLYKMLVDSSATDMSSRFARLSFQEIEASVERELENHGENGSSTSREQVLDGIWQQWIDWEGCQRLRVTCFMYDCHQQFCYEQRRCQPRVTADDTFLIIPCAKSLWNASSSQDWYAEIQERDCAAVRLIHPENMTPEQISRLPLSSQADAGAIVIELLPSRDQAPLSTLGHSTNAKLIQKFTTLFPQFIHTHAYLALYHTPLHQLLSLTGNTWLFGQKITSHSDIDAISPAVRLWASSPAAAQATWHACHLLRQLFRAESDIDKPFRGVSEYWFLYVSTLIIWAFGHRPSSNLAVASSGSNSTNLSRRASSVNLGPEDVMDLKAAALAWTEAIIELKADGLINSQLRTETGPAIDSARQRLKDEAVMSHGRSGMLLDACGVLDRLRESRKWF